MNTAKTFYKTVAYCFSSIVLLISNSSFSDTLRTSIHIPVGKQGKTNSNIPRKGLSQEQVQVFYGQPSKRDLPVGVPPISVWHYQDFSVYFEFDQVIHSVVVHKKQRS